MDSVSAKRFLSEVRHVSRYDELSPGIRRTFVGMIGGLVLFVGVALIFLPGPAFIVIPLGLAILATESAWARHYLLKAREFFEKASEKSARNKSRPRAAGRISVPESPPTGSA
jgi:hypothetical protein